VRVDPAALAARIRALMVQNDPDAVRAELEAIADALTERSDSAELLPAAAAWSPPTTTQYAEQMRSCVTPALPAATPALDGVG
jgi:hypothetical protein